MCPTPSHSFCRIEELLSLPFQDITSTFLLRSCLPLEEKITVIEKPLWEGFLFPGAHIKSVSPAPEKFREGQWHHHGHTANPRDSPTLALRLSILSTNCFFSLTFRNNWMGRSVWSDIMWFCSREPATYLWLIIKPNYLKETSESDLWVFPWELAFFPFNQFIFALHFDIPVYIQSGRHWVSKPPALETRLACFQIPAMPFSSWVALGMLLYFSGSTSV